jgi:branched-chain amino acid transport system permease protein
VIQAIVAVGAVVLTVGLVTVFPRSILLFLLFQGSLLYAYVARIPNWLRAGILGVGLLVLMPVIGAYYNGYYLEVATQVGIFAALALGLNIVVGLAGLLDLGYVAFFAIGAYTTAVLGSAHTGVPADILSLLLNRHAFSVYAELDGSARGDTGMVRARLQEGTENSLVGHS